MTEPRWDLIRHIRQQITNGNYDTPKRFELALRKALEQIEEALTSGSESVTFDGLDTDTQGVGEHGEEGSQLG